MHFHRRQGFLPDLVTRIWYPRRLRVPSLNKIAQTVVRPSPLWEFRAANCFRDFIVAWQNENLRWSGLSYLSRITGIRRSVANGFCVSAFCPLECKRIRSASLRWWSFQNLRWSQLLTSVYNWISPPKLSFRYDKWLSLRNEDLHLRDKAIRLSASCHSL